MSSLTEVWAKIVDSDVLYRLKVINETNTHYLLKFPTGEEVNVEKPLVQPGRKYGVLEFVVVKMAEETDEANNDEEQVQERRELDSAVFIKNVQTPDNQEDNQRGFQINMGLDNHEMSTDNPSSHRTKPIETENADRNVTHDHDSDHDKIGEHSPRGRGQETSSKSRYKKRRTTEPEPDRQEPNQRGSISISLPIHSSCHDKSRKDRKNGTTNIHYNKLKIQDELLNEIHHNELKNMEARQSRNLEQLDMWILNENCERWLNKAEFSRISKITIIIDVMFRANWFLNGFHAGVKWLMASIMLIVFLEYAYYFQILQGDDRNPYTWILSHYYHLFEALLLEHIFLKITHAITKNKVIEHVASNEYKRAALSVHLLLSYSFFRVASVEFSSLSMLSSSILQLLYCIISLSHQTKHSYVKDGWVDRCCIISSPFILSLPLFSTYVTGTETDYPTLVLALILYSLGFIIWLTVKLEREFQVSYPLKVIELKSSSSKSKYLIESGLIKVRHGNYLGIIIMTIGLSMISMSIWSILTSIAVTVYLVNRAKRMEILFKTYHPAQWDTFKEQNQFAIFPF